MLRLLICEGHKFRQLSGDQLSEVIAPSIAALRAIVNRGVASGEFQGSQIAAFPQVLVGPVVLAMIWRLVFGERNKLDLEVYMEAHLEMLLHGLRKAPSLNECAPRGCMGEGEFR